MFDAWGISIFVGFDFHNVDTLRLKSRMELLTLLFRKLLILRIIVLTHIAAVFDEKLKDS